MVAAVRKSPVPPPNPAQIPAAAMNLANTSGGGLRNSQQQREAVTLLGVRTGREVKVSGGLGLKPTLLNSFLTRKGKKCCGRKVVQSCGSLLLAPEQAGLGLHQSPLRTVVAWPGRHRRAVQGSAVGAEAALGKQTCKRKYPRCSHTSLSHTPAPRRCPRGEAAPGGCEERSSPLRWVSVLGVSLGVTVRAQPQA